MMPSSDSSKQGTSSVGRVRMVALIAGLAVTGLYVSTLTANNFFDSVVFAMYTERAVASGSSLLELHQPRHVLHLPLACVVLKGLHAIGIPAGALVVLQLMAAVAGGLLASLSVKILAPRAGLVLAVAGALGFALSAGVWIMATDGENNVLALAAALWSLAPALAVLDDPKRRHVIVAGILLAITAAFHLTLGTLWIALLATAAMRGRTALRNMIPTLGLAGVLLALAYIPRIAGLNAEQPGWTPVDLVAFTKPSPEGGYLLKNAFAPFAQIGSVFEGAAPIPGVGRLFRLLPALWLLAGLVALALRRVSTLLVVSGLWFLCNVILFAAWGNREFEFASFLLVPLALFGTCGFAGLLVTERLRNSVGLSLIVAALGMGLANFRGFIGPGLDPRANPHRVAAEIVASNTAPIDVVVVTGLKQHELKVYVPYWSGRTAIVPEFYFGPALSPEESLERLRKALGEACSRGAVLHALPDVLDPALPSPAFCKAALVRSFVESLAPVPEAHDAAGGVTLFRLSCP